MLAGGKGVRLHPFTVVFPKPLVPLGDRPIIEVLIERLISFGITDITLTLGHLAELIKAYFQHRPQLTAQASLRYVDEEEPTGTAGSLASVEGLDQTFLVMNGDCSPTSILMRLCPSIAAMARLSLLPPIGGK